MPRRGAKRKNELLQVHPVSTLYYGWKANGSHPLLCELDALMRAIPFCTGYALQRWLNNIDVELPKEAGNLNTERMRTIVLIALRPITTSTTNSWGVSRAMACAEQHQALLAPEQHGSCKRLSSSQASVNN